MSDELFPNNLFDQSSEDSLVDFDELDFIKVIDEAFAVQDPFAALLSSSMIAQITQPDNNPFTQQKDEFPAITELAEMFFETGNYGTDILLMLWDKILPDFLLSSLRRKQISRRIGTLPRWLRQFELIKPSDALVVDVVTGESQTIGIEMTAPWGKITSVTMIAYSGMAMIEDSFFYPGAISEIVTQLREDPDPSLDFRELSLADAKAIVAEAVEFDESYIEKPETETWPACKPLLRWVLNQLPDGGQGHLYSEYTEDEYAAEVSGFMNSPFSSGLGKDAEDQAGMLLEFASKYGSGDIRQWSAQLVERLLLDILPRKMMASQEYLRPVPKVMGALIRYYHSLENIPSEMTDYVINTIAACKAEYRQAIKPGNYVNQWANPEDLRFFAEQILGSANPLGLPLDKESLDAEPLPKEKFKVVGVSKNAVGAIRKVAEHIEKNTPASFGDQEMVRSALRILTEIGQEWPEYFLYEATNPQQGVTSWDVATATAICWIAGKGNNWFDKKRGSNKTISALKKAFDSTSSPNQRGETLLSALPGGIIDGHDVYLWNPALLTSTMRKQLIAKS